MMHPFNGFLFVGEFYRGPWLIHGFKQRPVKRLFSLFGRDFGLISVMRQSTPDFSIKALNLLRQHFVVEARVFDKEEMREHLYRKYWDGRYPNTGSDRTVLYRALHKETEIYIGDIEMALFLVNAGIEPENQSIGFCQREQKWYGWSHRARCGFGIGDVVREGDCCANSGWSEDYLAEHPEADLSLPIGFTARNLDDCRRMAIAFADSVS